MKLIAATIPGALSLRTDGVVRIVALMFTSRPSDGFLSIELRYVLIYSVEEAVDTEFRMGAGNGARTHEGAATHFDKLRKCNEQTCREAWTLKLCLLSKNTHLI